MVKEKNISSIVMDFGAALATSKKGATLCQAYNALIGKHQRPNPPVYYVPNPKTAVAQKPSEATTIRLNVLA